MAEHFDVVVLGGGPGGYAAALVRRGRRAATSPWSRRPESAAPACTGAASRPRSCSRRPRCCAPSAAPRSSASTPASRRVDLADEPGPQAAGGRPAHQGPRDAAEGAQGHGAFPGPGPSSTPRARHVRVSDGTELTGDALILATGSAPRSIPGFDFDGDAGPLVGSRARRWTAFPAGPRSSAAVRSGASSRRTSPTSAARSPCSRRCRASSPGSTSRWPTSCARSFKKRRIKVETGVTITGVDRGEALTVHAHRGDESGDLEVDAIVVSVGRRPRSEGIGLEGSGIVVDERGFVVVDDHLRTAVPGVYAVGDLVPTPALAHVGLRGGDRRDPHDPRRGRARRSTTTGCRGASTATRRSRSPGSPSRRPSTAATTS